MRHALALRTPLLAALIALFTAWALPQPAAADDTAAANRLFVAAMQSWNAAEAITGTDAASLEARLAHLREVQGNLRRIVEEHSGADMAVRLVIGERVGPLSLPGIEAALSAAEGNRCRFAPSRTCVLAEALTLARVIQGAPLRAVALSAIATLQNDMETFAQALAVVHGIEDAAARAWALSEIAAVRASPAFLAEALDIASGIDDAALRDLTVRAITVSHQRFGSFADVLIASGGIGDIDDRAEALNAVTYAEAGNFADALARVRWIEDAVYRALAMIAIATAQAEAGRFADALTVAQRIPDPMFQASALRAIAMEQAQAGLFTDSLDTTRGISFELPRALALGAIAAAQAQSGRIVDAREFAHWIKDEYGRVDAHARAQALAAIAPYLPD